MMCWNWNEILDNVVPAALLPLAVAEAKKNHIQPNLFHFRILFLGYLPATNRKIICFTSNHLPAVVGLLRRLLVEHNIVL